MDDLNYLAVDRTYYRKIKYKNKVQSEIFKCIGGINVKRDYYRSGQISKESWTDDKIQSEIPGSLHRIDGPACTVWNEDGTLKAQEWIFHGELHRWDGPAQIFFSNNEIYRESWYNHGKKHRIGGPAIIEWTDYNRTHLRVEEWWIHGILHREDGPSYSLWYGNGSVASIRWLCKNTFHREDGPAMMEYYPTGKPKNETWYVNGLQHRIFGPSHMAWHDTGKIQTEVWMYHGLDISVKITKIISKYDLPHWSEWDNETKIMVRMMLEI